MDSRSLGSERKATVVGNKSSKEEEIRGDLTKLLQSELSNKERSILSNAVVMLDKKEYFPKIISNLESKLTPLAVQQQLSKNVSEFYLKITSHKFKNKGLGIGILTVGKMFF